MEKKSSFSGLPEAAYRSSLQTTSGDEIGKLVNKGLRIGAAKFYRSFARYADYPAEELAKRLRGIDFDKDVFETTLKKGTEVIQYVDETTGRVGNYFAPVGSDGATLGIEITNRTQKIFKLTEDVNVLQSTAADIVDESSGEVFKGGGTQFFSPELNPITTRLGLMLVYRKN